MFYCNPVSSKLNSNFNDLLNNNTTIQTTATTTPNIPSPSLSSSSNSSSPLKETTFRQTKLQKIDFNNINVQQSPTNNTNKLMASIYYNNNNNNNNNNQNRESTISLKRKISNTDFDDTIENIPNNKITVANNNNNSSSSSTIHSNFHVISTKPTETQYINQKSILYIYYKFDLATAIDDHFTKSFNNKNNVKSCKILQLGKNKKSDVAKPTNYKQHQSNHNNYWTSSDTLKQTTTTPDVYTWPYYSHHAYTNSTPSNTTSSHNTPSNSTHVQDSWNRAAVDMAASLYSNPHYASSLTNIHHHHHHQYNSLLTNNVTNNSNHLYNQPTTAADLLSTLTNRNETTTTRNDISLLTQKFTKNSNQDGQSTPSATTSSNSFMAPTNSYNFAATNLQQNETSLEPYHTDTSSSSTQYGCSNESNNFIDYTANSNVSKGAAAAALVAANQYLNASLNTTNSGYQHRYHHHHHPQYLNHFDLTKNSIQDCRRATNHYAHLSTHLPYSGS